FTSGVVDLGGDRLIKILAFPGIVSGGFFETVKAREIADAVVAGNNPFPRHVFVAGPQKMPEFNVGFVHRSKIRMAAFAGHDDMALAVPDGETLAETGTDADHRDSALDFFAL